MMDRFVSMNGSGRYGDDCACGNSHTIGKCKWAQHKTIQGDWEEACLTSAFFTRNREYNKRMARPSIRWVSLRRLSILCILSIPAFVQPSSLITASTSRRSGSIYSGWARRRYNTCVTDYWHAIIRLRYERRRQDGSTCQGGRMNGCKIDYKQSPCKAFDGPLHSLGLSHEPHQQIVL